MYKKSNQFYTYHLYEINSSLSVEEQFPLFLRLLGVDPEPLQLFWEVCHQSFPR